jgi:hypothetical protein
MLNYYIVAGWEIYVSADGLWRWRCHRADSGIDDSGNAFTTRSACLADAIQYRYTHPEESCHPADVAIY